MARLKDILEVLNGIAEFDLAESWDNVGLMVGDPEMHVSAILVALDPTKSVVDEAVVRGCNVLVAHHPLIFEPVKSLRTDRHPGKTIAGALAAGVAVVSCHTNLDVVPDGVSDQLAVKLGLVDTRPLTGETESSEGCGIGFGRIGRLAQPLPGGRFLDGLLADLGVDAVGVVGRLPALIETVAVCGGSGSSLVEIAKTAGAQVYVSGEIKHSTARWAEAEGFCLLDCGHYATEQMVVPALVKRLQSELAKRGSEISVMATGEEIGPIRHYMGPA